MLSPAPPLVQYSSGGEPMKRVISVVLITAVSAFVYTSSLGGGFVFDDHRAILTNDDLDSRKTALWELFTHDFWGGAMSRRESHKSYRPLTVLTYRYLNYYFAKLEPFSYHLVNVLFHAISSLLFLLVAEIILPPGNTKWPFLSALLFATHSIHTEAVASVVGRAELLCCIFFLLSFILYSHSLSGGISIAFQRVLVSLSVLLAFLSMLSKEQGITVLGVCACYDILLHWPIWISIKNKSTIKYVQLTSVVKRLSVLVTAGVVMVWYRMSMNHGSEPIFKPEEMRAAFHPQRMVRVLSFSNIYVWNAWLLLAPSSLCCDWSLGTLPVIETLSDVRNIWSVLLYIGIVALVIISLKGDFEVGMGLAFILIPFFPSAGIVLKVGFVIAERVLYLPSLGFCLLVTIGAKRISQKIKNETLIMMFFMYILMIMSAKTVSRNWDWWSDLSLFESGAKVNSNNVKMHNNYAMELKSAGRFEEAERHYKIAMKLEPDYAEVYFNYGNLLSEIGQHKEALTYFEKAMTYPHMYSKTLNNAATMYFKLGRYSEAEEKFKESLKLNPDQPMTYNNLASLYGETKKYVESEKMFKKTIEMSPGYTEAYFNLGTLLYQMGKVDEAEKYLKYALKLNPLHHGALNNLKVIDYYRKKEQIKNSA